MKDGEWYVLSGTDKKPQLDEKQILHQENLNDKALSLIGLELGDEVIHHLNPHGMRHVNVHVTGSIDEAFLYDSEKVILVESHLSANLGASAHSNVMCMPSEEI